MKTILAILILVSSTVVVFGSEIVKGRVWKKHDGDNFRYFPEQDGNLVPERLKYWKELKAQKKTVGLVFSGGGTRSASLTLGQLRALNELGFLENVQYISSVSGGSWTSAPFTFYQGNDDERFLGRYIQPHKLSSKHLKSDTNGTHLKAIANSNVFGRLLKAWFNGKGDESYANVIGKIFLKPHGLNENRFFTASQFSRRDIISDNHGSLNTDDFYMPKKDRPFLIVNATLQKPHRRLSFESHPCDIFPLEITPLYVGIPSEKSSLDGRCQNKVKLNSPKIGGGYVETLMYDSLPPTNPIPLDGKRHSVTLQKRKNRFTLSDAIGASGAAPQAVVTGHLRYLGLSNIGFPEFYHFPVVEMGMPYEPERKNDWVHGDGGNIENLGLLPLLSRQVDKIIVFINTKSKVEKGFEIEDLDEELLQFFGEVEKRPKNTVFPKSELNDTYKTLANLKNHHEPLVYCRNYTVLRNEAFNITNKDTNGHDYKPKICWVYNDKPKMWTELVKNSKRLTNSERHKLVNAKSPYRRIPHTNTFLEQWNDFQVIDRSKRHVNAESNIAAYVVCEKADYLARQVLGTRLELLTNNECTQQERITREFRARRPR